MSADLDIEGPAAQEARGSHPAEASVVCFVGFFGITRSLRYTIGSIQRNVLAPLRAVGATVRLHGHFHLPPSIDNPRSGEAGLPTDPTEAALLGLDRCVLDAQDDALIADTMAAVRRHPDVLQDDYRSARNLCFQLRSLDRLWASMADDVAASSRLFETWVALLRPDLHYLDPFPWHTLLPGMRSENLDLAVPSWHSWGGMNDRFAVATPDAAAIYATRGLAIGTSMAAYGGLHAESLLMHVSNEAGLRVTPLPVRAVRIRANGMPEPRDLAEFGIDERALGCRAVA